MLKKFLGIFKRDKREFSDEELKWQINMLFYLVLVLMVAIILSFILVGPITSVILLVILFVLFFCFQKISKKIDEEMTIRKQRNSRQEILQKIENKELSDLDILNDKVIQELYQECLSWGIIEISRKEDEVKIIISKNGSLQKKVFIVKTHNMKILDYFKVKK